MSIRAAWERAILGFSPRNLRRWRERYEKYSYVGSYIAASMLRTSSGCDVWTRPESLTRRLSSVNETGEPIGRFQTTWVTAVLKANDVTPKWKAYGWTALTDDRVPEAPRISRSKQLRRSPMSRVRLADLGPRLGVRSVAREGTPTVSCATRRLIQSGRWTADSCFMFLLAIQQPETTCGGCPSSATRSRLCS